MDDLPYRDEFNSVEMRSCDLLDHTSVILRLLDRTKHGLYTRCGQINRPVLSVSEQQQRMRAIVCKTRRLELTSERSRSQRLTTTHTRTSSRKQPWIHNSVHVPLHLNPADQWWNHRRERHRKNVLKNTA